MKNVVIGICSFVLTGILVLTLYTLHGCSIRQEELDDALACGLKTAMEQVKQGGDIAPESDEELKALFLQCFLQQIDSNSQVTVHILEADHEKGLLSVEAVLTYRHPVGTEGRVTATGTVILEQEQ